MNNTNSQKGRTGRRIISLILTLMMLIGVVQVGFVFTDAATSKTASPTCGDLSFWAPEAIYLYPDVTSWTSATATPFQYYINNNSDGTVKSSYDKTGYIYYSYATATNATISYRFLDRYMSAAMTGGSVTLKDNLDNSSISTSTNIGSSKTIKITDGKSPSLTYDVSGCYIEWILSFTDTADNRAKKAYAYTYIYKPYVVPFGSAIHVKNTEGSTSWGCTIAWVSGVHSITANNECRYPNYTTSSNGKGFAAFLSDDNVGYVGGTKVTGTMLQKTWYDAYTSRVQNPSSWYNVFTGREMYSVFASTTASQAYFYGDQANSKINNMCSDAWSNTDSGFGVKSIDYYGVSKSPSCHDLLGIQYGRAKGNIYIDTSRYNNLSQIPNLGVGLMNTDDESSGKGQSWYIADNTGISDYLERDYFQKNDSDIEARFNSHGTIFAQHGGTSVYSSGENDDEGPKYLGAWVRSVTASSSQAYRVSMWACIMEDSTGENNTCNSKHILEMTATQSSKATLRAAVQRAIKKMPALGVNGTTSGIGKPTSCYFDADTNYKWTTFQTVFQKAVRVLGSVDMKTGITDSPASIASSLESALSALCTKVTLNANGGSMSGTSSQYFTIGTNQTISVTPKNWSGYTAPTRTGYTFGGWATTSTATTGADTVTVGYNNTLYAVWIPNQITLKYNGNGYTGGVLPNDSKFNYGGTVSISAQVKREYIVTYNYNGATGGNSASTATASYTWGGWKSSANSQIYTASSTTTDNFGATSGTVTLTAQWTATSINLPTPTKTGYSFNGWYTANSGGTKVGDAGAAYTPTADITVYARWTPNKYTLNLNGNLDGVAKDSLTGMGTADVYVGGVLRADDCRDYNAQWDYGTEYTIKDIKADRGYTYEGASTVSGTVGASETIVALRFHTNTYTINFNGNGATGGSTASLQNVKWGADCQLTSNGFQKDGYTFAGWAKSPTGNVEYGNNATVNTLTDTDKATITLYAKWTAQNDRSYKLNVYVMNTAGVYPTTPETYVFPGQTTDTSVSVDYTSYIPTGKDTTQFYLDQTKGNVTSGTVSGNNDLTLVVYIARRSHTVTYNYSENGGVSASDTSAIVYYDGDISFAPTAVKTGWTFLGWNTLNGDTTGATISSLKMGNNDVVLYAAYSCTMKVRSYYIDPMKSNTRTYTDTSATIYNKATSISIPTYNGVPEFTRNFNDTLCTFRGYTTGTVYTGTESLIEPGAIVSFNSSVGFTNDKVLATYSGCYDMSVELTHDATGGELATEDPVGAAYLITLPSKFSYTIAKVATQAAPTRQGYTFIAWARTPEAEQSKYIDVNKELSLSASTTVYAIWLKNWDSEDEANRADSIKSIDIVSGAAINADNTVSTATAGKSYKYTNYSEFERQYNSYVTALNTYNTASASLRFVAAKALENALKSVRAYYAANLNSSNLANADLTYLSGFTVTYAAGARRLTGIVDGTHTLAEMNLNHYSYETLESAKNAKVEADELIGRKYKVFDKISGYDAQAAINMIVEKMAKAFVNVEKVDSNAGYKLFETPASAGAASGNYGDIDAINYVDSGKNGATYYCYTNKKNPTVVIDAAPDWSGRVCLPITATVTGGAATVTTENLVNDTYIAYTSVGMGTSHTYNAKSVIKLTPSFTTEGQTVTYTVKGYDNAYSTGDADRNYLTSSALSGSMDNSYKPMSGNTMTVVICYKAEASADVIGDTWENADALREDYNLTLTGMNAADLTVANDPNYAVVDPQYGQANYGSFVYFFQVGASDNAATCTLVQSTVAYVNAFFADTSNYIAAVNKGYADAPDADGLGLVFWTPETGSKLTCHPAENIFVYVHLVDKWGNSIDKVMQTGKFRYFLKEAFELVGTAKAIEANGAKYVVGLKAMMTTKQFNNYISCENCSVVIEKSFGSRYMGTGSKIKVVSDLDERVIDEYIVIVFGDVNGDAKVNLLDAVSLMFAIKGFTNLSDENAYAANVRGTRPILDIQDVEAIFEVAIGYAEINQETGKVDE